MRWSNKNQDAIRGVWSARSRRKDWRRLEESGRRLGSARPQLTAAREIHLAESARGEDAEGIDGREGECKRKARNKQVEEEDVEMTMMTMMMMIIANEEVGRKRAKNDEEEKEGNDAHKQKQITG